MTHYGDRSDNVILSSELSDDVFRSFNPLAYCSAIRVSALKEIGGWNVKYVHGWEDYELWVELWERGKKFIRIPEIHFYYNRHGESMIDTSYKPEAVEYSMGLMKRYHPGIFGSL
jgi:GT2 family glycosyltransferase